MIGPDARHHFTLYICVLIHRLFRQAESSPAFGIFSQKPTHCDIVALISC